MTITEIPTQPSVVATWSDVDERFFRIVQNVFDPEFLYGASVLIASNDDE